MKSVLRNISISHKNYGAIGFKHNIRQRHIFENLTNLIYEISQRRASPNSCQLLVILKVGLLKNNCIFLQNIL
jgi:hypothetical protein